MVGSTLRDISRHVDCLAARDGPYAVVCGRTGCEPHPVSGLRFDDRDTAAEAAEAAAEYRATLRQYDPQVPFYEPLVHDVEDGPAGLAAAGDDGVGAPVERHHVAAGEVGCLQKRELEHLAALVVEAT